MKIKTKLKAGPRTGCNPPPPGTGGGGGGSGGETYYN